MNHPGPTPRPAPGYGSSRTFGQKLGIYLAGIAIGLLFLGWIQVRKRQAAAPPPPAAQPASESASEAAPATNAPPPDAGG